MTGKERLSASVDSALLDVGRAAVEAGTVGSLSAWVNDALQMKAEHDRAMRGLDEAIAAYEAEFGKITAEDIAETERWVSETAIRVRRSTPDQAAG